MSVIRIRTTVPENRKIVIELPEDMPRGEVDVEVRLAATSASSKGNGERLREVLEQIWAEQRADPDWKPRSKEDIDRLVQEERDSWD